MTWQWHSFKPKQGITFDYEKVRGLTKNLAFLNEEHRGLPEKDFFVPDISQEQKYRAINQSFKTKGLK